jgi:hypothetical protein
MRFAFVLLRAAGPVDGAAIARAHQNMFRDAPPPVAEPSDDPQSATLKLGGDALIISLMPVAVPNFEADEAARFSIAAFGPAPKVAPHTAHLMVVYQTAEDRPTVGSLQRFTRALAAIVATTDAVGVYWGDAGATHPAKFFVEVATDPAIEMPMFLWTGLSIASAGDGRTSLLSTGLWPQLKIPDLEMTAPSRSANAALGFFFDMLAYVARRGSVPNAGETIGRTPAEKWVVSHGKSPIDPERPTWRVDLPADYSG